MAGVSGRIVWRALAALVAGACIAVAATPEAGSAARPTCDEAGGKTIVENERVRAFARKGLLYACAAASRRTFVLGDYTSEACGSPTCESEGIDQVELAGRYVAYVEGESTRDAGTAAIFVLDTKRARERRVFREGDLASMESVFITGLAVTRLGGIAWIVTRAPTGVPIPGVARVFKQNAGASRELLDEGEGIDTESLALSESERTVYWTSSGLSRSRPIK